MEMEMKIKKILIEKKSHYVQKLIVFLVNHFYFPSLTSLVIILK